MTEPQEDETTLEAAVSAALDEVLGPVPGELTEEQAPSDPALAHGSGAEEERYRTFPARFGG